MHITSETMKLLSKDEYEFEASMAHIEDALLTKEKLKSYLIVPKRRVGI